MKIRIEENNPNNPNRAEYKAEGNAEKVLKDAVDYLKEKDNKSWVKLLAKEIYEDYQALWNDMKKIEEKLNKAFKKKK